MTGMAGDSAPARTKREHNGPDYGEKNSKRARGSWRGGRGRNYSGRADSSPPGEVAVGMSGVLVSTVAYKERTAAAELNDELTDELRRVYPDIMKEFSEQAKSSTEKDEGTVNTEKEEEEGEEKVEKKKASLEDQIASEISEFRSGADLRNRAFKRLETGCKSLVFLKLHDNLSDKVDITRVVVAMVTRVARDGCKNTRYAVRVVPIAKVVPATYDDLAAAMPVDATTKTSSTVRFGIQFRARQCSLERDNVISKCAAQMATKEHTVDLSAPDVSIVIEALRSVAAVAVVPESMYLKLRKFNLPELFEQGMIEELVSKRNPPPPPPPSCAEQQEEEKKKEVSAEKAESAESVESKQDSATAAVEESEK